MIGSTPICPTHLWYLAKNNKQFKIIKKMKKTELQLLLKDLCARVPYGVKCNVDGRIRLLTGVQSDGTLKFKSSKLSFSIKECCIKPYLYPIKNMTKIDFLKFCSITADDTMLLVKKQIDFLEEHNYDHGHLIEHDLAIDATDLDIY